MVMSGEAIFDVILFEQLQEFCARPKRNIEVIVRFVRLFQEPRDVLKDRHARASRNFFEFSFQPFDLFIGLFGGALRMLNQARI